MRRALVVLVLAFLASAWTPARAANADVDITDFKANPRGVLADFGSAAILFSSLNHPTATWGSTSVANCLRRFATSSTGGIALSYGASNDYPAYTDCRDFRRESTPCRRRN